MHLKNHFVRLIVILLALFFATPTFAHGVIESPASREQFCGVESKPDEIYKDKMTHEKCRPMMTKGADMDNSVYNFMAVLSHTLGRSTKAVNQLPTNVCGFSSEMWSGGKTPWDKAMDWPTSILKSGPQNFVWNISWGTHFSDTEEFVYWITKPDFKFDPTKELTWNDFETTPFCQLKYNDLKPNENPNIIPDKINNRFTTKCNVPSRTSRSVIYGEWGRTSSTYERFHSCIDVMFSTDPSPSQVTAIITPLSVAQVSGSAELQLDASRSIGSNLTYTWSIDAENLAPYQLENSKAAKTRLTISNINAQQSVTVNLIAQQGQSTHRASVKFIHKPGAISGNFKMVGRATLSSTLKAGDKIQLRLINNAGKDYFIPTTPLVLTEQTAKSDSWAYALAQLVNPANEFSAKIGVLQMDNKTILPIKSSTDNMIYVPSNSLAINGFIQVEESSDPTKICLAKRKSGSSSYWLGYDVYASNAPIVLDFKKTGIDLTKINFDKAVFANIEIQGPDILIIRTKPEWVSKTTPGYLGMLPKAGAYEPLNSTIVASCHLGLKR